MSDNLFDRLMNLGVEPYDMFYPVYKYRSINSAIKILESNQLYFATSKELNDKLEFHQSLLDMTFTQDFKERFLDGIFKYNNTEKMDVSDEQFNELMLRGIDELKNTVGVFSTSKSPINSYLWENYGDNHKGVCLGFKTQEGEFGDYLAFNVNYTDKPKKIRLLNENEVDLTDDIYYFYCTKHKSFISEEEVRLIDQEAAGLRMFNKKFLFEIIFGHETTEEEKLVVFRAMERNGYSIKRLGKIVLDDNVFGLTVKYY